AAGPCAPGAAAAGHGGDPHRRRRDDDQRHRVGARDDHDGRLGRPARPAAVRPGERRPVGPPRHRRAGGRVRGVTTVSLIRPALVVPALGASSASFVVIYGLTIVAYARGPRRGPTALVNAALLPLFVLGLAGQPAAALFPLVLVVAGFRG